MTNKVAKEDEKREIIYRICDKRTLQGLEALKLVNRKKADIMQEKVFDFFKKYNKPITYDDYKRLTEGLNTDISVTIRRKNDLDDLNDIEDFE